jgi:hypothetical protein
MIQRESATENRYRKTMEGILSVSIGLLLVSFQKKAQNVLLVVHRDGV